MARKFVLIEPKSTHLHVYSSFTIPRLGVILLGTMLRDRGWDVRVYIEDVAPVDMKEVLSADVVGISTLTSTAPQSYRLAEIVREAGIPVIIGGTHVSFLPDEALDYSDYVVRGEGEETLFELLDAMDGRGDMEKILGLSYWKNNRKTHNPDRPLKEDLDSNPIPDYGIVEGWNTQKRGLISIATSRGCPFTCTFCSVPGMYGHGFRMHSIERVIEEIRVNNPKYVFFADDLFTANRKRTKDLLKRMIEEGLTPEWGAQIRTETAFDPELLELMKASNCFNVFIGFESINPQTLDLFNKRQTYEKIVRSVEAFNKHGIRIHGMFVVGADTDDKATIFETARLAKEWNLQSIQLMILTPLPGSPDFDHFYATGNRELLYKDWSLYDGHHTVYRPKNMTAYELNEAAIAAMEDFYSWKNIARSAMRRDYYSTLIQFGAKNLLKNWRRENKSFLEELRSTVFEKAEEGSESSSQIPRTNRVGVPRFIIDSELGSGLVAFFARLGSSVVPFSESPSDGQEDPAALSRIRGKVDCIVLPVMERARQGEEEFFQKIENLKQWINQHKQSAPTAVSLVLDKQDGSLYSSLAQLGAFFTKDLDRVHQAYKETMAGIRTIRPSSVDEVKPVMVQLTS
ncbi:MAG: radical SAM protein [Nitrospiraceae bacterium]|nr:radical SAM protein [Nitrospiraceae bacterium]